MKKRPKRLFNKGELLRNSLPLLAKKAENIVRDLDPTNDLLFLRIKTKSHEIMFAPDKDYYIFTLYDFNKKEDNK